ncbi:Tax1-binding protein 3 like protein [Argiope bruennichi]|uniref:Tax1-binding protein 3 like protein n=1 Tax=Argiope bruennichi TaxID=94029 RepID=A0A8T0ED15_ARGBR|nr:Tax1-binding protein 3 like protein [Argiope bruennichi]
MASQHQPGIAKEYLSLPILLMKEPFLDEDGEQFLWSGFSIVGGADPAIRQRIYNGGIYISNVTPNSPASKCGLKINDKILQVNGYDLTTATLEEARKFMQKYPGLWMLVARTRDIHF